MMHTPGLILLTAVTLLIPVAYAQQLRHPTARPNILWLVADDMNWDSPGCFGGVAEGVT